ncbi:hypothetical protein M3Y96_01128300 [Aphelenchoides besseyi]|nr:hypothetical protein M3Y96_01128300 [Aphelenchoides besseyi]
MQLQPGSLDDLLSEDEDFHPRPLDKHLSNYSSIESLTAALDQDAYASDAQSEDLDKLSLCLSEVGVKYSFAVKVGNKKLEKVPQSPKFTEVLIAYFVEDTIKLPTFSPKMEVDYFEPSDAFGFNEVVNIAKASSESNEGKRHSLFGEVIQAQLALWTLIGSILYSYAWQQHRKKFLLSLFIVIPTVVVVCCTMSWLLTAIVIMSRMFSTSICFEDILKSGETRGYDDDDETQQRWRTSSVNSCMSLMSNRSSSGEDLPKPMCRKHSSSNGSLNQISLRAVSPSSTNGSIRSPSHRLSYTFAHCAGGGGNDDYI